ncbi:MAG: hypothetical protein LH647_16175 [Leptolyngbyaceae cyanobacterium CAN_BIN12]|nr:hypothetical protein [Leptolyngbyaceae cyanobacterium CAN_BIN12]
MKNSFSPIRDIPGEFRVALNISELGDRAWEVLAKSQTLGFDTPKFETHIRPSGFAEVWAVVLCQVHSFDVDMMAIVDPWDEKLWELEQLVGDDPETKMRVNTNFRECLIDAA